MGSTVPMTLAEYNRRLKPLGFRAMKYERAYIKVEHACKNGHRFVQKPSIMSLSPSCPFCLTAKQILRVENVRPLYESCGLLITKTERTPKSSGIVATVKCKTCGEVHKVNQLWNRPKLCSVCTSAKKEIKASTNQNRYVGASIPKLASLKERSCVFIQKLAMIHPSISILSKYKGASASISLKHSCGHRWKTTPTNVLASKVGCPVCGVKLAQVKNRKPHDVYLQECLQKTNGHLKPIETYRGDGVKILHSCVCGKQRLVSPSYVLYSMTASSFCRSCCKVSSSSYSNRALTWLRRIEQATGQEIQHGDNGGEFVIGKYRVDGYCKATKTVYEFLGNDWHGFVGKRPSDKHHPHNGKRADRLLFETLRRLQRIADKGYTVVYVWESHYSEGRMFTGQLLPS